ncbi:MAG: hypothetical protein EAY75_11105 [Bacteroidetes bacterium]|nr:MAG: hypothetical protein EAY75_11105 [Bacteroidota bacterium]
MAFYHSSEHTPTPFHFPFFVIALVSVFCSCVGVKNHPANQPFPYNNKINIAPSKLSAPEKKLVEEKLYQYLDDSLRVGTRQIVGFTQRVNPAVFDSASIDRSMVFMQGYLQSIGYYGARFDSVMVRIDTVARKSSLWHLRRSRQQRVTTTFNLSLGNPLKVDTTVFIFTEPYLQFLADSSAKSSFLKKDAAYSKEAVNAELERLSNLFRGHGYLKMSKSALRAHVDTIDAALVSTDFADPITLVLAAARRRADPRITIDIEERPGTDSSVFVQYYIDSITFYPEMRITDELVTTLNDSSFRVAKSGEKIRIKYRDQTFSNKLILRNNHLVPGQLYRDADYARTINGFWKLGPWQQVEAKATTRVDSLPRVNFNVFLTPYKKRYVQFDVEGSQNNNISSGNVLSGRFAAASLNITHRNRNFMGRGTQGTTSLVTGVELNVGKKIANETATVQSFITNLSQSFSFPKLMRPFAFLERKNLDAYRSQLLFNLGYADRFDLFKQFSFTQRLQWEMRKGKHTHTWSFPNLEVVRIEESARLKEEFLTNPGLRLAFTPGYILSGNYAYERSLVYRQKPWQAGFFRLSAEATVPGSYSLFNQEFFQFVRFDGQFVHNISRRRHSWNFRFYGAVGWNLKDVEGGTMPYFRQYIGGGSNSMRAWGLRQLGFGHSIHSDTSGFSDRFGDIQLEWNAEYRFKVARFLGYTVNGVLFADVGNVWNHTNSRDGYGKFELRNLYRDLAMGVGTGIRYDISYVVVRFDVGYKLKNPVLEGNGWVKQLEWQSTNRLGVSERSNVGFQFGIGYPF